MLRRLKFELRKKITFPPLDKRLSIMYICSQKTNVNSMHTNQNEIILYQPDNSIKLEVKFENETVWLSQNQIAKLFGVDRTVITKHLRNIFGTNELDEFSSCAIFAHVGNKGKQQYQTKYYNLDAILSVGYRVNSINATSFRRWATQVIKDFLLRGYAINQRIEEVAKFAIETEKRVTECDGASTQQIDSVSCCRIFRPSLARKLPVIPQRSKFLCLPRLMRKKA